jgi:16S rRNA (uracil1498-N3)-methyltransferase
MRHIPRIHVTTPLFKGARIVLSPPERHHLLTVFRMQESAEVRVFNATSGEWSALLIGKKRREVECLVCVHPPVSEKDLGSRLLFPLLKGPRLTFLIEKAVELGVGDLQPVITDHAGTTLFSQERWQMVARQATEQCGRLSLPSVQSAWELSEILETWSPETPLFVADERPEALPVVDFLGKMPNKTAFLIGPEGGFSEREFITFARLPFVTSVSLGKTTLRTETAACALLALYATFCCR